MRAPRLPRRLLPLAFTLSLLVPAVVRAQVPPPPTPTDTTRLGLIQHVRIGKAACDTCPTVICPGEPVPVTISGQLPSPCIALRGFQELPVGAPFTVLQADFVVDTCGKACPTVMVPFSATVTLPPPLPGTQSFVLMHQVRSCPDTTVGVAKSKSYTYVVPEVCPPPPIPLDSLLRSFVSVSVLPEMRCVGDTLRWRVAKRDCPPCFHLRSLSLDPLQGFLVEAEWRPQCVEFACNPETLTTVFGVLPAGHYESVLRMRVHVLDTTVPDSTRLVGIRVPFDVLRDCPPPPTGCVQPWLVPARGDIDCDVRVAAGGSGDLSLAVNTPRPLAGLEGRVECTAPFRVGSLRIPPGRAGWHLSWQPDGRGARYVLFSTPGFDIPAGQTPVLVAGLEVDATAVDGQRASLVAPLTLVSDPAGNAVPICDPSTLRPRPAALCVGAPDDTCDVNGDGRADVRDLVRMTACLRPAAPDFDSAAVCHDCDGDGTFAFADLLCCARHILRAPLVPRDSVTASPDVRVEFGVPQRLGTDGWRVPVRVTGADALAGVLLRLRYPADRWRADGLFQLADARGGTSSWMAISDFEQPGLVQLAWLQVGETPSPTLEMELAVAPVGEVLDGDAIAVVGADLVRPDGRTLEPTATLPELSLVDPAPGAAPDRVVLGAARPNPFTGTTRFTVSLPAEAELELSVHDVAGRRVATLAHGRFAAGERDFRWDATGAHDGVYFVRLVVDGHVLTSRVALLRDRR